jgi:hypothetical protein
MPISAANFSIGAQVIASKLILSGNEAIPSLLLRLKAPTPKNEYQAGFRNLLSSAVKPTACYGVYSGDIVLKKDFGLVLPWQEFLKRLYAGEIIG